MENILGTVDLLVKRNVLRYPEKIASIYGEERLTYGEMNQRINGMINGLASLGIKKGDRVAIFSQNHGRYLEFLFGAAKAGFALCTINFMLKEAELVYILKHSEAKAIIYHSGYHDLVEEASTKCIFLKHKIAFDGSPPGVIHYEEMVASSSKEEPDVSIDSDDLLLLVYTSGTTGKPKGVMLSHYNIFFNALDSVTGVELEQDTINLNVCPLYHVAASVLQTYGTLYAGGTSVTLSHFDPREVLETIERERVNFCFLVPTMIFRILELSDVKKYDLSSLRKLGYGAAPMPYDRLKKSIEVFGQEVLFQGYGLTEATANICILRPEDHILDGSEAQQKRLLSCGREHSNHQLRVFDDNNKEVKQGEVGEILFSHPSVLEAAVAGVSHRDFGEVPRAFVALREGATATEEEIIQFCKEHLASYKCPKSVTFLDELPKTASGKITRAGIQEKYVTRKERS